MKGRVLAGLVVCIVVAAGGASGAITDGLQSYWNFDGSPDDYTDKIGTVHLQERAGHEADTENVIPNALILRSLRTTDPGAWLRSTNPMGTFNVDRELTISVWVCQDLTAGNQGARMTRGSTDPENSLGSYDMFSFYTSQGAGTSADVVYMILKGIRLGVPNKYGDLKATISFTHYKWYHVVMRIPSTAVNCTLDIGSIDDADMSYQSTKTLWDGNLGYYDGLDVSNFSTNYLTVGGIDPRRSWYDELAIWNRELSDAEVEDLHDMGRNGEPIVYDPTIDLQSYWNFDRPGYYDDVIGDVDLRERAGYGANIGNTTTDAIVGYSLKNSADSDAWLRSDEPMGTFNLDRELTIAYWLRMNLTGSGKRAQVHRGGDDPENSPGNYAMFSEYTSQGAGAPNDIIFAIMYGLQSGISTYQHRYVYTALTSDEWHYVVLRIPSSANNCNMNVGNVGDADLTQVDTWNWWGGSYTGMDVDHFKDNYLIVGAVGAGADACVYMMDELAIWNRCLSDVEIEYLFELGKAGTPIQEPPPPNGTLILIQ